MILHHLEAVSNLGTPAVGWRILAIETKHIIKYYNIFIWPNGLNYFEYTSVLLVFCWLALPNINLYFISSLQIKKLLVPCMAAMPHRIYFGKAVPINKSYFLLFWQLNNS